MTADPAKTLSHRASAIMAENNGLMSRVKNLEDKMQSTLHVERDKSSTKASFAGHFSTVPPPRQKRYICSHGDYVVEVDAKSTFSFRTSNVSTIRHTDGDIGSTPSTMGA